jgi:glycerophosphoryl diester phosphodiesterase
MKRLSIFAIICLVALPMTLRSATTDKQLIAHRGASGDAPEHTMAAYRLALAQHADFVEPDLAVSKDGQLICLHDDTLERTTNVATVFPDRFDQQTHDSSGRRRWLANDFTLDEITHLDAGIWRGEPFRGEQVPSFEQMVALVRGKAGIYPELKSPPLYMSRGVDMTAIFVRTVKRLGLDTEESLRQTPMIIQSFDEPTVQRVATELPNVPRVFLTSRDEDVTDARLDVLATFATGIAPEKQVIARHPDMVARAHARGLTVTAWTFRADEKTTYPSVRDEMQHFLYDLNIDALFTNNPDAFPRR